MATARYKVLGQVAPSSTAATTVYTVGASKDAIISTLSLCNIHTAGITVEVHIRPGGGTLTNQHYLVKDLVLAPGETEHLTLGIGITATDVLAVKCDIANGLAATATGTEITYP